MGAALGHPHYEAGMYLDKYFVQKDIRFIARATTWTAPRAPQPHRPLSGRVLSSAINTSLILGGIKTSRNRFGLAHMTKCAALVPMTAHFVSSIFLHLLIS